MLKYSGCEESGLGVESADDNVLRISNKKETAEQHKKAIRLFKDAGIKVKPYWMTGLPGETDETIELNKQFMIDTQPEKWTISTFTPYPGCSFFNNPDKFNFRITEKDYSKWWNFCEEKYNHELYGQTQDEMWARYKKFYLWLKEEKWKN